MKDCLCGAEWITCQGASIYHLAERLGLSIRSCGSGSSSRLEVTAAATKTRSVGERVTRIVPPD
jgi:hypothetical protein